MVGGLATGLIRQNHLHRRPPSLEFPLRTQWRARWSMQARKAACTHTHTHTPPLFLTQVSRAMTSRYFADLDKYAGEQRAARPRCLQGLHRVGGAVTCLLSRLAPRTPLSAAPSLAPWLPARLPHCTAPPCLPLLPVLTSQNPAGASRNAVLRLHRYHRIRIIPASGGDCCALCVRRCRAPTAPGTPPCTRMTRVRRGHHGRRLRRPLVRVRVVQDCP